MERGYGAEVSQCTEGGVEHEEQRRLQLQEERKREKGRIPVQGDRVRAATDAEADGRKGTTEAGAGASRAGGTSSADQAGGEGEQLRI